MSESLSGRWYTPFVVIGVAALLLVIVALAIVEVLVAAAPPAGGPSGWNAPIDRAGEALRDGDVAQALAWWHEARREALRSGTWEAMVDVGDASRRLAADGGFRREGDARAREAYMTALLRARRDHSVDGVLRAAVAFGELGDREVVAHAVHIAEREAGQDPRAREQVRAVAARFMSAPLEAGTPISPGGPQK
jgi:hypothetical protein